MSTTRSAPRPAGPRFAPPVGPIAVALLWLAAVAVASAWSGAVADAPPLCLFRRVTGTPCPTCGTTRAVLAALDGRLLDALRLNPLACAAAAVVAVVVATRLATGRRMALPASPRRRLAAGAAALALLVANWAWVILLPSP